MLINAALNHQGFHWGPPGSARPTHNMHYRTDSRNIQRGEYHKNEANLGLTCLGEIL